MKIILNLLGQTNGQETDGYTDSCRDRNTDRSKDRPTESQTGKPDKQAVSQMNRRFDGLTFGFGHIGR